jgi:zinc and cadmium transporter
MTTQLMVHCVLIVISSVAGGLLPLVKVVTHVRMQVYLSFSAGVMLGSALLHMLPEAAEIGGPGVVRWALPGLLTLFMIERFFSFHHHEFEEESGEHHGHAHDHTCSHLHDHGHSRAGLKSLFHWKAAAIGLALHSLLGGVALASAETIGDGDSWGLAQGVFLATLLHKPADALTITSLMRHGRERSMLAHLVNLIFALMIPAGAVIFSLGQSQIAIWPKDTIQTFTAAALAFSSGTFLCISLSDLLPELHFHSHDRVKLSISLLAGVALMGLVAIFGD